MNNSLSILDDSVKNNTSNDLVIKYIIQPLIYIYRELISKYDGDNCPFEPSCSIFFLEGAKRTNLIEAILIFSDRLTRDFNIFNRENYPHSKNGKLLDSIEKYLFNRP